MRSASSSRSRPSQRRRLGLLALGALALAVQVGGARPGAGSDAPLAAVESHRIAEATLGPREQSRLRTFSWQGGSYTSSTGESVRVLVSDTYADGYAVGQRWANYFASLLHGSELGLVTAYVLSPTEMEDLCGPYALGCYGGNELAFMGETVDGVTPEEVASHEYGHHVAANRLNPPWLAVDWGTKRWAAVADVCLRAKQGTAFPGNEDGHYTQNPGEAFAEVFRVLNELKSGAKEFLWPLVDWSFRPDATALAAVEQDVVAPWATPTTQSVRARFVQNGKSVWKATMKTPLDGSFSVTFRFPKAAVYELTLLGPDGRTVVGQGLWSARGEKRLTTTICGERSVTLRVTRRGPVGRFSLRVTHD